MLAYTYVERGKFALLEKPKPALLDARDAIVKVTLASICTSDLHIKHGSVPRASRASPSGTRWWASWSQSAPRCAPSVQATG